MKIVNCPSKLKSNSLTHAGPDIQTNYRQTTQCNLSIGFNMSNATKLIPLKVITLHVIKYAQNLHSAKACFNSLTY